jgi:hypothetical protein
MARRPRRRRRNTRGRWGRLPLSVAVVTAAVIGFAASSAYTASNAVPATHVGQYSHSIGPNELKPPGCASLTLGHLILGSTGGGSGSDDDLVLGTSGGDTITESGTVGTGSCLVGGLGPRHGREERQRHLHHQRGRERQELRHRDHAALIAR